MWINRSSSNNNEKYVYILAFSGFLKLKVGPWGSPIKEGGLVKE